LQLWDNSGSYSLLSSNVRCTGPEETEETEETKACIQNDPRSLPGDTNVNGVTA